jgi:prepilin-type N-terminal cleavage/methylation domain-containing protein
MGQLVRARADSEGFTLFELMIVVSIISLLLGLGISILSKLSYRWGFEASVMQAQSLIRGARNFSLTNETCSEVHIIPRENKIIAMGEKTVAQWHFEDGGISSDGSGEIVGAYGIRGNVTNAYSVPGKTGYALQFGTGQDLQVKDSYVDCGSVAAFTPPAGIIIEAWIYPGDFRGAVYKDLVGSATQDTDKKDTKESEEEIEERARRRAANEISLKQKLDDEKRFIILIKEGSYYLGLTINYALEFTFADTSVFYPLRTYDNVVTPNMWNHVMLRYSGAVEYPADKMRIYVNDIPITVLYVDTGQSPFQLVPVANIPKAYWNDILPPRLTVTNSSLFISDPWDSFFGNIDDVRIGAVVDPEVRELSSAYLMGYPQTIYFDSQGRLDPERHSDDVWVLLTENPRRWLPKPENDDGHIWESSGGGMSAPISSEEALKEVAKKQTVRQKYRHAYIAVNKYGKMDLTEVHEEETEGEQ